LKNININNFDTSSVTTMEKMFYNCKILTSLDLKGFNTSLVKAMNSMFESCTSLVTIDISSFDTHSVTSMDSMFQNAESLISLDLSNFNISSLTTLRTTFKGCKSLIYLNLISFIEREGNFISLNDNLFSSDQADLLYCIDGNRAKRIFTNINKINTNNDCNNTCFSSSKKIILGKKICIDNCANDDIYIYEYKNICYNKTEYESIIKDMKTNEIINESIEKTDKFESTDKNSGDNQNTIEITEKSKEIIKSEKIEEILTTQILTENIEKTLFIKTDYLTEIEVKDKIENTIYKSILNTNSISKETININKPEVNKTTSNFNSEQFFKLKQEINVETISEKDNILQCIKEDLINGSLKSLLLNLTSGEKKDLTSINKDIIYQITTISKILIIWNFY
jgi:surface protein